MHISSAGVTRPNRPGIDVSAEPPAVKLNDALGGLLTFKLRGEEAVVASGVPFAIIRPVALTEARLSFSLPLSAPNQHRHYHHRCRHSRSWPDGAAGA